MTLTTKRKFYEFRVRRVRRSYAAETERPPEATHSSRDVAVLFRAMCDDDPREVFMVVSLDVANRVLGIETVAVGSAFAVDVHPRETFRAAILTGAAAIVLGHNHPSGDAAPSEHDWQLTERMRKAGTLLGIPVLDHVIVTRASHCSMAEDARWGATR